MKPITKQSLVIFVSFLLSAPIYSQEVGTANYEFLDLQERKDWTFKLAPYAWLAGTSTDVGSEQIRQSFNDLSSLTNIGFQMLAQVRYKKWSLSSNFTYAKLGDEMEEGPLLIDFNIDQLILDTKFTYTVIDQIDHGDDIIDGWAMDISLGAIYWVNDLQVAADLPLELPNFPVKIQEKQKWVDMVMGTNFRILLSKSVLLGLSANIGGFGIGDGSDIYWDINYVNTFKVSKLLTVTAGYKTFNYKRTDGEGDDKVNTKVKTYGPLIGLVFNL